MVGGVKHLMCALERAMGSGTKKGQVQEPFCKKLQWRPGQSMVEWFSVFQKAVRDIKRLGHRGANEHGLGPLREEQFFSRTTGTTVWCHGR